MMWAELIAELLADIIALVRAEDEKDKLARLVIMQRRISDAQARAMQ